MVLRIAGGIPERAGVRVLEGHQGRYAAGGAAAQVLLAGSRQGDPDALTAMLLANGEPVQVPPPAIPAGDQGADDLATTLRYQQGSGGIGGDQALDVLRTVRRACVFTPLLGP